MLGVVLGILQNAGHDLDRFTDEELRRATELAYDASVRALAGGAVRPGFSQEEHMLEDYEVLDATELSRRLGFKRDTVLAYLSRRNFGRIPRPNRQLAMGPIWYERSVKEWEAKEKRTRGE